MDMFKDLALIIVFAKIFGLLARKCKVPQVVGEITAGLVLGTIGLVNQNETIGSLASIGVILLMFSAGLGTDLSDLKETGLKAFFVACCGVIVPLIGGTLLYMIYNHNFSFGNIEFYKALFVGTIMTATSVSITVSALKEMGYLKGKVGTTIVSAAIIDDIIGIIVLTIVSNLNNPSSNVFGTLLSTFLYLVFILVFGWVFNHIFRFIDKKYPHTRRVPILSLGFCFANVYIAEKYFGIADVTGAFLSGIILCNLKDSNYIQRKIDIESYILFTPIFFASIGLKTDISAFNMNILGFTIMFCIVALITKIIGCYSVSRVMKYSKNESLKIGVGMMTRGEVALIVSQKGLSVGLVDSSLFVSVIILIILSSILSPVLLNILYKKYPEKDK